MMYPGGASLIASATWLRISSISWRICWMYSSREILGVGSMARSSLGKSLTYIDQTAWIAPGKFATHLFIPRTWHHVVPGRSQSQRNGIAPAETPRVGRGYHQRHGCLMCRSGAHRACGPVWGSVDTG